jgi:predicted site-specific integrase-resolvase
LRRSWSNTGTASQWFGAECAECVECVECVEAALSVSGRRLLVVDPCEVDDDLVRGEAEILTALCARMYGPRAGANRGARAVESLGQGAR